MQLELVTVGRGETNYPGSFTKFDKRTIFAWAYGYTLHLFSGSSDIGKCRVDWHCKEATLNVDVFEFLEGIIDKPNFISTIILDPPYNESYAKKYSIIGHRKYYQFIMYTHAEITSHLFNMLRELAPNRIILKSWQYYIPKDYHLVKGYVCYPGGYKKSTFLLIMDRDR